MSGEDLCLRDLPSESISSLREDDLSVFSCRLSGRDDILETPTDTSIFIDREEYSIHSSYFLDYLHTKSLILEALRPTLEFSLFIVIHDHPDFVGSCFSSRKLEALDMSWVDRIEVSRCDGKSSHSGRKNTRKSVRKRWEYSRLIS